MATPAALAAAPDNLIRNPLDKPGAGDNLIENPLDKPDANDNLIENSLDRREKVEESKDTRNQPIDAPTGERDNAR